MSATAPAVNSVTLVGNLTADPVLKQLDDDRKVCKLRLAVNDQKDQPMFIDVATFGAQADACAKYLTKGRAVAVTGRLVYREWDDNGTRRSRHHIIGRVQFGGTPDEPTTRPTDSDRGGRRLLTHHGRRRHPPSAPTTTSNRPKAGPMTTLEQNYTDRAGAAILDAVREEHDFGGWLARGPRDRSSRARLDRRADCRPPRQLGSGPRPAARARHRRMGRRLPRTPTPRSLAHEPS